MSKPDDPFAPAPDEQVSLELSAGFELQERNATVTQHADFIAKAKGRSGVRARGLYWTLARVPVLVLLAWFTASH